MEQKNKKPVILVVDMDEGYINALETEIVQKYIDKADIEFITDRTYLQEYLKQEHFVTVLIAGESVYSEQLKQLMPVYTFVLMNKMGKEKLEEFVYGIFRYASSRDILDIITNKVPETIFEEENSSDSDTKVILVTSATGGVGKTTVALTLSFIAEEDSGRAMYINLDDLSNFERWLNKEKNEFESQILEVNLEFTNEMDEKEKLNVLGNIIRSEKYDWVIVDTGIYGLKYQKQIYDRADIILQITGNSNGSIYAANKLYHQLNESWIDKSIYVCGNDEQINGREAEEYTVQNRIANMKNYEAQTIEELCEHKDIRKLYECIEEKLERY